MSLSVTTRKDKKYIYFNISNSKRLYLGTLEKPNKDNILEAVDHLYQQIRKYESEISKLKEIIAGENMIYDIVYKLVIFDLDGVLFDKPWITVDDQDKVAVSTWNVLFKEMDALKTHAQLKKNYEDQVYKTYMDWTEDACKQLKFFNLNKETFQKVIFKRPLAEGAPEVFKILRQNHVATAVITGSFEALANRASEELGGIDNIFAHCKLHFDQNDLLTSWDLKETDYEDKAQFVERLITQHNISPDECVYIGDDVNDLAAFAKAGLAIAFNANKLKVRDCADIIIESRNLTSILPHLCGESYRQRLSKSERCLAKYRSQT